MDQRFIDLYDEYTHTPLDRRVFLARLAQVAGGVAAAEALLPLLENNYARAQVVPKDDPRLAVETVRYPGAGGEVRAYLAKPREAAAPLPAVVVIHENRGLNPHIEDVVRRVALAGFLALGPDLLSPLGGTPADEDKAREMIGRLDPAQAVANLQAAVGWLEPRPDSTGKVGAVGFCWGGGMVNRLAIAEPKLAAGVAFYGMSPPAAEVGKIRAPLLLHYAELDDRINQGVPEYEAALKAAGVRYELHRYPGVNHAFHNDTAPARYNAEAARLAWDRTVDFLNRTLKG